MMPGKKTILLICSMVVITASASAKSSPVDLIKEYISALKAADWKTAGKFWHPDFIARSKSLGITFDNVPVKFDCASNLFLSIEAIKSGQANIDTITSAQYPEYTEIQLRLANASDTVYDYYCFVPFNGEMKIVPRYYIHSKDWNTVQTGFTTIHYNNDSLINEYALERTDKFISDICNLLRIPKSRVAQLEQNKIDYYLCTEEEMRLLTGYNAHGLTNFQFDAVITRHLPHQHELAHLLINYALENVPLYTLPVFQEGFAVSSGGRWGKTPEVLMQLAYIMINQGFVKIEDLLGWDDFYKKAGPPELTYPAGGIFNRFILYNYGIHIYKKLYLEFSGSEQKLKLLTAPKVKRQITEICGSPWSKIESDFNTYISSFKSSGLNPGGDIPGSPPIITLNSEDLTAQIWDNQNNYLFKIEWSGDNPDGAILITTNKAITQDNYRSWMFSEQMPEADYNAERYGLVFNAKEAGLYDYYTNILMAKYVKAFIPSDSYISEDNKTIIFRLAKNKLKNNLNQYKLKLISN